MALSWEKLERIAKAAGMELAQRIKPEADDWLTDEEFDERLNMERLAAIRRHIEYKDNMIHGFVDRVWARGVVPVERVGDYLLAPICPGPKPGTLCLRWMDTESHRGFLSRMNRGYRVTVPLALKPSEIGICRLQDIGALMAWATLPAHKRLAFASAVAGRIPKGTKTHEAQTDA